MLTLSLVNITQAQACERIVSLSPSTTDSLDALGLGDKIVGFTRYCQLEHPNKSIKAPQVIGGFTDLSLETVFLTRPSIIFGGNSANNTALENLGFKVVVHPQQSLQDIEDGVRIIATACNIKEKGEQVIEKYRASLAELKPAQDSNMRVLILYGYEETNGNLSSMYGAGVSYHADILKLLGLKNAYTGSLSAPILSQESILAINPDIIFVLSSEPQAASVAIDKFKAAFKLNEADPKMRDPFLLVAYKVEPQWQMLMQVNALKNNKVYEIVGRDSVMPSIRLVYLAKLMAQLIAN
ncbi:ABC transporter substrate-binding protein [Gammaproteobacteria bacterium]|nr:ABC transporter substrate-binding protein [Gammaproteobacteria bacterium]